MTLQKQPNIMTFIYEYEYNVIFLNGRMKQYWYFILFFCKSKTKRKGWMSFLIHI